MLKALRCCGLFAFIFILLICGGGFLIYNGTINIIPKLLGTDAPKDLGIRYNAEDVAKAQKKLGLEIKKIQRTDNPDEVLKYEGVKEIDTTFTSKDITALINNQSFIYVPIANSQVRINDDNSVEWSGVLLTDKLANYATAMGVGDLEINSYIEKYNLPSNLPFYVKGNAAIVNHQVSLDTETVKFGRFTVPSSLISGNKNFFESFAAERLSYIPNLSIESMKIADGAMKLKGTMPAIESHVENPEYKVFTIED